MISTLKWILILFKEIDEIFGEISTRYKEDANGETERVYLECKQSYEGRMNSAFNVVELDYSENKLLKLHLEEKQTCLDDFKSKAAPDLWSAYNTTLEKVYI
jgi:hypothetical protein